MLESLTRRSYLTSSLLGGLTVFSSFSIGAAGFSTDTTLSAENWPTFRYDTDGTGVARDISLSEQLKSSWSRSENEVSGGGLSKRISAPVRANRIVCYTTKDTVVARGSANGKRLWTANKPESADPMVTPAVADGRLITGDGTVTAWDLTTGSEIWNVNLSGSGVSTPIAIHDNTVYIGTSSGLSGAILALDFETGERLWKISTGGRITDSITIKRDSVYVADDAGGLRQIINGETMWNRQFDAQSFQGSIIADSAIVLPWYGLPDEYADNPSGIITTVDRSNGEEIDQEDGLMKIDFAPIYLDGDLIVVNSNGQIKRQPISGGYDEWDQSVESISGAPILVDDTIVIGLESGDVIGIDPGSGEVRWQESVLDEPIRGLCAGQNAVYVTGKYTSIGGLHYEPSLTARGDVQRLIGSLITADSYGITESTATQELVAASEALLDQNYAVASEAATTGQNAIDEKLDQVESTQETIRSTRETASELGNQTTFDPNPILNTTAEATTALDNNNNQQARELAEEAAAELSEAKGGYENATAELSEFNETIRELESAEIPLGNATEARSRSQHALEQANFETAASVAATAKSALKTRMQRIEAYRAHQSRAQDAMQTASTEGIQSSKGESIYQNATEQYDAGEYEAAAQQMENATNTLKATISTAQEAAELINRAEEFDPITPFVHAVADTLGSRGALSAAKSAYSEGSYQTALSNAERALSKQTQARIIINGGLLSGVGMIILSKRYDGLERVATYLADTTGEDEIEEL